MNAEHFAAQFKREAEAQIELYTSKETMVGVHLESAALSSKQRVEVIEAIKVAVIDSYYTLLLGLDGAASIGGNQQVYSVLGENGESIYSPGELEAAAWEAFYGE